MPNEYYRPVTRVEEDMWHNGYISEETFIETDAGLMARINVSTSK